MKENSFAYEIIANSFICLNLVNVWQIWNIFNIFLIKRNKIWNISYFRFFQPTFDFFRLLIFTLLLRNLFKKIDMVNRIIRLKKTQLHFSYVFCIVFNTLLHPMSHRKNYFYCYSIQLFLEPFSSIVSFSKNHDRRSLRITLYIRYIYNIRIRSHT